MLKYQKHNLTHRDDQPRNVEGSEHVAVQLLNVAVGDSQVGHPHNKQRLITVGHSQVGHPHKS